MLQIITNPNPILRKKSLPVADVLAGEIQGLIPEMIETMIAKDGVGLAAPQIGRNIRLITVRHKDADLVMINPEITKKSFLQETDEEGCLSVPGKYGMVKRHKRITAEYLDQKGAQKKIAARGLLARVIQHEVDHLDGVLFIDRTKKVMDLEN